MGFFPHGIFFYMGFCPHGILSGYPILAVTNLVQFTSTYSRVCINGQVNSVRLK